MASNGVYGTRVASRITPNDVDIFYSYSPTRNSDDINKATFTKLPSKVYMYICDGALNTQYFLDPIFCNNGNSLTNSGALISFQFFIGLPYTSYHEIELSTLRTITEYSLLPVTS